MDHLLRSQSQLMHSGRWVLHTVNLHELLVIRDAILIGLIIEDIGIMPIRALLRLILGFFRLPNEVTEPATCVNIHLSLSRRSLTRHRGHPLVRGVIIKVESQEHKSQFFNTHMDWS